jgi:hypothetical protein
VGTFTQHAAIYFFERHSRRSTEWPQVHKESLLARSGIDIVSPARVSISGNTAAATNAGEPWDNRLYERSSEGPEPWHRAIDGFQVPGSICRVTSHDIDGDVVVQAAEGASGLATSPWCWLASRPRKAWPGCLPGQLWVTPREARASGRVYP